MRPNLKFLLTGAFVLVATVPVIFLGVWVERTALDKEIATVEDKHLVLARNVSAALERYAKDTQTAFQHAIKMFGSGGMRQDHVSDLVEGMGLRYFGIISADQRVTAWMNIDSPDEDHIPRAVVDMVQSAATGAMQFSEVMGDRLGRPTIFIFQRLDQDRIAIGALSTDYIVTLQRAIRFGKKGHAAIVDHQGTIIAHPFPDWESEMASLAGLEPVQRMIQGETGVTGFYSPAVKKNMISGYATVSGVGWGVMVPQPMEELEERAQEVKLVALFILLAGLATAAVIAWFIAGILVRPVRAVVGAARKVGQGDLDARVSRDRKFIPEEFRELSMGFNYMANQIQQNQQIMAVALHDARLADKAKSEFLANMSHELRTPLNAIIGFSEAFCMELFGPLGNEQYQTYARDMEISGQHLLSIINDILDLSKIEAGTFDIEDDVVEVDRIIEVALILVEGRAEEADVEIRTEFMEDLPLLRGSRGKLQRVLVNLLSNAIKFTPSGGALTVSACNEEDGTVAIRVSDTGIGMSAAEIELALTPFGQVDGRLARKFEGTGLGLPLAKRLVELHGGELVVHSTPGQGTEITMRLPADRRLAKAA